ncbi:MAG: response regulator [Pseudomonadota bacterium]
MKEKTAKHRRILLVEDSPHDVELMLQALGESHLNKVVVAPDGEQALDYLYLRRNFKQRAAGNPAVVLLDLKLPKIDGLEVLERIKTDPALKNVPVVMLSSSHEEQDLLRSYSLGVNAYVVKPVGFQEFTSTIKEIGIFWGFINQPPPAELTLASQ